MSDRFRDSGPHTTWNIKLNGFHCFHWIHVDHSGGDSVALGTAPLDHDDDDDDDDDGDVHFYRFH